MVRPKEMLYSRHIIFKLHTNVCKKGSTSGFMSEVEEIEIESNSLDFIQIVHIFLLNRYIDWHVFMVILRQCEHASVSLQRIEFL